jgi:hypothetical protein
MNGTLNGKSFSFFHWKKEKSHSPLANAREDDQGTAVGFKIIILCLESQYIPVGGIFQQDGKKIFINES